MKGRDLEEPKSWEAALLRAFQGWGRHKSCRRILGRGPLGPLILFTLPASLKVKMRLKIG